MSDRNDPAPTLDSQNARTKLDRRAQASGDVGMTLDFAPAAEAVAKHDLKSIGPYHLVRKLGEGGMGQVWLAEQNAPLRRQIALKLLKVGTYDDSVLQRFYSERQSLAIMEHPSIAKVFDAGATPDGQPYFVMEYVPGVPITDYCDQKRMKVRERLELFIGVCEGVQHAHQKAIIHRDLKPANILVVKVDGKPVPRIIDFGLAKAVTPTIDGQTLFTQAGGWVGTPGYMSPEQADPGVADVDTRTDVYSLGAVLYVLLTGFLPFETQGWRKQRWDEFLRRLREEDPPCPSTKVGTEKASSKAMAEVRGTEPKQLISLLHGDLDWITMKALERDCARRYGTPSELAADVGRYLKHEAVTARPAGTGYRLQKYVRRHRMGVAVATGLVLLLAGFAAMQGVQLRQTTRERDRANRITDFMTGMFKVSDPSEARGNSITAREILDKASKDIDAGLAKDPEVQAQMMYVMGNVYDNLGLYSRAHFLLERSLDVRRRVLGPSNPETLKSMGDLGSTLSSEGHLGQAEKLLRETIDFQRRVLGPDHPNTLSSMERLANTLVTESGYAEAEKLHRQTLEARRRVLGPEHIATLSSMHNLGMTLRLEGRYIEAEKLHGETLEARRRVLGPEHPHTLASMRDLAVTLEELGRLPESEKLYREALDMERRILGPEHPQTVELMDDLSTTLLAEGHYAEAEKLSRDALEIDRRTLGAEDISTMTIMSNLANILTSEGHYAEGEKLQRETVEARRRVLGPVHRDTLESMNNLGNTLTSEGHYADAEKLHRETLEVRRRLLGPEHPETASSTYNLACVEARRGNRDGALELLRQAVDHGLDPATDIAIDNDLDLKSLHSDPRFDALVAHARVRAAAAQKKQ